MIEPIPEVVASVIGATTLNLYSNALNELLGISHAPRALSAMRGPLKAPGETHYPVWEEDRTSARTKETRWQYHVQPLLFYALSLRVANGATATCTIRDETASTDLGTVTTTSASWDLKIGTIDISAHVAAKGYVVGDMIELSVQLHTSNANDTAELMVFGIGQRGVIAGWQPLPSFTDATTSDPADLNALRTNINILADNMVSPVNELTRNERRQRPQPSDDWDDCIWVAYRYRGGDVYVAVEGKGSGGNGWKWRLVGYPATDVSASGDVFPYTSDWIPPSENYAIHSELVDISALGWTIGNWYVLKVEAERDSTPTLTTRRVWILEVPGETPRGSWAVPNQFAKGDTDLGNAEASKWTADLTELYTGGGEELWGDTPAILPAPNTVEGDDDDRAFTGVHRFRWLNVKPYRTDSPVLRYGADMKETHTLIIDPDLTWQVYDLDTTEIPVGGYYAVTYCEVAFESQEPCNNAA